MRCLTFLLLFFSFFCSSGFSQTTKIDLQRQVTLPITNDPVIMTILPGVGFVVTKLDANSLELFTKDGSLFLRSKPSTTAQFKDDFFKLTALTSLFRTSAAVTNGKANLMVFYNGLLQREGEDYDVAQEAGGIQAVTFKTAIGPGNSVTLKYTIN